MVGAPGGTFVIGVTVCIVANACGGVWIWAVVAVYVGASPAAPAVSGLTAVWTLTVVSGVASATIVACTASFSAAWITPGIMCVDWNMPSTISVVIAASDSATVASSGTVTVVSTSSCYTVIHLAACW